MDDDPAPILLSQAQADQVKAALRDMHTSRHRMDRATRWLWIAVTINLVAAALNLIIGRL
jgi:hypothetical protein